MKHLYTITVFFLCLTSCNSVKQSVSYLQRGQYDQAINTSLDKIRKNPSIKKRDAHILILEEAFAKAVQRDNDRIDFLKKEGQPTSVEEIYERYTVLNNRQEKIRPLLPLRLEEERREASFVITNYNDALISYKNEFIEQLYSESVSNLERASSKIDYRNAYTSLERLNELRPNYKDVASLLEKAHYKGTDYIEVALYNDSNIALPKQLKSEILDFSTYDVNSFWKVYHSTKQENIMYDYVMDVSLKEINISPERVQEKQLIKERKIKDGTTFLKNDRGQFVLDEDGKKIVVDRFIDVSCNYYEIYQSKAVNIVGKVRYNNSNGQLVESFPLTSQYAFEHYYATYQGDKRALDDISLRYIRNKEVSFPTNEQMIYDVGEDLKNRLKRIIVNSNL